jgi:hypothetical protein
VAKAMVKKTWPAHNRKLHRWWVCEKHAFEISRHPASSIDRTCNRQSRGDLGRA